MSEIRLNTETYSAEERDKIFRRCIDTYGHGAQEDMAVEEMSELIKTLMKIRRATMYELPTRREEIIEEVADVKIMMRQLEIMYHCDDEVQEYIDFKVGRQIARLDAYERELKETAGKNMTEEDSTRLNATAGGTR